MCLETQISECFSTLSVRAAKEVGCGRFKSFGQKSPVESWEVEAAAPRAQQPLLFAGKEVDGEL